MLGQSGAMLEREIMLDRFRFAPALCRGGLDCLFITVAMKSPLGNLCIDRELLVIERNCRDDGFEFGK